MINGKVFIFYRLHLIFNLSALNISLKLYNLIFIICHFLNCFNILGDLVKAEAVAREALQHLPSEASLHFNLANTLGKAGKYIESERHFLKAIELNDQNPTYHTNLGKFSIFACFIH